MPSWTPGSTSRGHTDDEWETSNGLPSNADLPPLSSEVPGNGRSGDPGLDGELDDALEDFDGGILAERKIIRERSNKNASANGNVLPSPPDDLGSARRNADLDHPGGTMGVPQARNTPPRPGARRGQVPNDLPDAKDDDIIARQLREAAMSENNPELKEKLWDEYRRYKGA